VGLRDFFRRMLGRDEPVRGVRGARMQPRGRDDVTMQLPNPHHRAPAPVAPAPLPRPSHEPPGPAAYPPPPAPAPVHTPPQAPVPAMPAAPAPQPPAPPPAPAPGGTSEARTQYLKIPSLAPVTAVLVGIDGDLSGEVFKLRAGENKLGRSESCDVVFPDPSLKISREHATVICEGDMFAIAPLNDKNPTFVNDEATEGSELNDGDLVRMGRTTFRFRTIPGL
jgi:hypothetical protein